MKSTLLGATAVIALTAGAQASEPAGPTITYVPNSIAQSKIRSGPWTLHESAFPRDASGIKPTTSGPPYAGSGFPYKGYCSVIGQVAVNYGLSVMQPYYFPFVRRNGPILEGFFDYRPRNEQEAVVTAISSDGGVTWTFTGMALGLNTYCPSDDTDPDNLNVSVPVLGVPKKTAYGSNANNAADNGLGHPVVLTVNNRQFLYQLNRANGFIDSSPLVVHQLPSVGVPGSLLALLPAKGYQSPLAPGNVPISGNYPTLQAPYKLTSGLIDPDAFIGALTVGGATTVVYVSKNTSATADTDAGYAACPKTPSYALTNLINGSARKANHDLITIRVATTTDGINFTDVGPASGLFNPGTTSYSGTRWLGSGSLIRLASGKVAMFFGAGNCLDNDLDGFHYIGYAETTNPVTSAADLQSWTVFNALDNPILSTDRVTNTSVTPNRTYPLNAPLVNVSQVDLLTPAQVAPWTPPTGPNPPTGGYTANFFSGRAYDPQAIYADDHTVTIVFAGYNTPQPSNNLGDYRSIGRFQLQFPRGYLAAPQP